MPRIFINTSTVDEHTGAVLSTTGIVPSEHKTTGDIYREMSAAHGRVICALWQPIANGLPGERRQTGWSWRCHETGARVDVRVFRRATKPMFQPAFQ